MIKPANCLLLIAFMMFFTKQLNGQSYHALAGSPYAGVTSMYNNPASTVNQARKWDVTVFSLQSTISNTAFVVENNSLTNTDSSSLFLTNGLRPRYFHADLDLNLFNARIALNSKSSFAFGVRLRTYNHARGMPFFYYDTILDTRSFLHANNNVSFIDGYMLHAGWAELNMNYSRVLFKTPSSSLSGGITFSYMKGLSGGYSVFSRISYQEKKPNTRDYFVIDHGGLAAAYSDNYFIDNNSNTNAQNVRNFISKSVSSFGLDLGAEYLIKNGQDIGEGDVSATNYDWKLSASIMDIGRNKFNPINGSFSFSQPKLDVIDTAVQKKLLNVTSIVGVRDTLARMFTIADSLTDRFTISLPTRMVLSVDHNFGSNFYVNGELSLNFYSTRPSANFHTREINLLTVTPRWETQAWGVYMPLQYNSQGQFWVGAAVKLGPLLLGVHSLDVFSWFKTRTQTYNGGGYLLLTLHPFGRPPQAPGPIDCPTN